MSTKKQKRNPYIYEALGIEDKRVGELVEMIYDEIESEHSISDSIKRIQFDLAKTDSERNFMLFTFGYNIRELDMMNQMLSMFEEIYETDDEDIDSDMMNVLMPQMGDSPPDIFMDVT